MDARLRGNTTFILSVEYYITRAIISFISACDPNKTQYFYIIKKNYAE